MIAIHPILALCRRLAVASVLAAVIVTVLGGSPARAATSGPAWQIDSVAAPNNFQSADSFAQYTIVLTNVGGATASGPITLTDTLPADVTSQSSKFTNFPWSCSAVSGTQDNSVITCTDPNPVAPLSQPAGAPLAVQISSNAAGTLTNQVEVSSPGAPTAQASFTNPVSPTVTSFGLLDFTNFATDLTGAADTQAADHPNSLFTSFQIPFLSNTFPGSFSPNYQPVEDIKDVVVDLPAGLVGNPQATPRCTQEQFTDGGGSQCPAGSQLGVFTVYRNGGADQGSPIYNLVPDQGYPAEFGLFDEGLSHPTFMYANVVHTASGYVLRVELPSVPRVANIAGATVSFFGDPASADGVSGSSTPFITNPSDCSGQPLVTTIHVDSWENPAPVPVNSDGSSDFTNVNFSDPQWLTATSTSPPVTGCNELQFKPTITVQPDTTQADAPAGLNVDLKVPQNANPNGLATPDLRNATVTLPEGVSVNPDIADGLQGCSDAQIAVSTTAPATCPLASQIGTVQIHTPLLPAPLTGQIFLGTPNCSPCTNADAQDGNMLRLFLQAQGSGVLVKLPGTVSADPTTGQLTAHFEDNPQLPFDDLQLSFNGGPRGALATPDSCGTYTSTADLAAWSSPFTPDATPFDSFAINSGCVSGFSPSFTAGTQIPQAGAFSPFVLSFSRTDTDQDLSGLSVTLPDGMLAKLAGVQECSDAQLTAAAANSGTAEQTNPSCPAGSQVGTVTTTAGPGSDPFALSGKVYLTGPYKGGPYGLAVVVPVVAGPFDLGTVVVRQALEINPTTAQVTDVSDPLPTILDGIPLRIRSVSVDLNRPDFTVNPTSCNPTAVTGTLSSTGGMSENVSSRFQVGGCQGMGFSPRLTVALTGKGTTKSGDHPTLTATLSDPARQANLRSARVALPLSLALDPNNSSHVCQYATAQAVRGGSVGCRASTIVGRATAVTPLLSQPLTGNVYLVQGLRCRIGNLSQKGTCANGQAPIHTLPTLLVPLRGQIALDLRAQTSVSGGKLVTTFPTIPDAPVSKFTLKINGGKKGLLVITGRGLNVCAKKQIAGAKFGAQSGKTTSGNMTLSTPCGKAGRLKALS